MNIKLLLILTLLPLNLFAQSEVIKLMKSKTRFTVIKVKGFAPGRKIFVHDADKEYLNAEAGLIDCKVKSCLAEIISDPNRIKIEKGSKVTIKGHKRNHSIALTVDNPLGVTLGAAYYYSFPRSPWNLGVKGRRVQSTISGIDLEGVMFGLEVQRYIWHKSRWQIWGSVEAGIMNVDMDLRGIIPTEPIIKRTENYFIIGGDGRYNLAANWRLTFGLSLAHNSMSNSILGESGEYELESRNLHFTQKLGLLYFF